MRLSAVCRFLLLLWISAAFAIPTTQTSAQAGADPTVGLLPSGRSAYESWRTAGLQSIGNIPNRTKIFKKISPSGGDDTSAIQATLSACPPGQVVQLTAGVFRISGNGLYFSTSNCTLRGVGPGQQLNTGNNPVGSVGAYVVDPTATQLIKTDRATSNYGVLYIRPSSGGGFSETTNLAADATQGNYNLTLASIPKRSIKVGDIVLIDMNTDHDPDVVYGPSFGPPGDGSRRWFMRQDRSLNQLMEVVRVDGNTITFNTPFHITFKVSYQAQLTQYTAPFLRQVGVENLFVWGGMGGDYHGNIAMNNCAYCWVKNVEAAWSVGTNVGFYSTFRSVLRDSFVHETPHPDPGGAGYQTGLSYGASDNLFENNIIWYGNKEIVMRATGGGNVIAYNYMDDSFGSTYPHSPEAGINAGHYTTPHMELLEGNYSQNYSGDSYWGNSIYITVFRNWLSGLRAAHPPLNTYVYTTTGGICDLPYGDYSRRAAVDVQAYSYYQSFVGNVLGTRGQQLFTNPHPSQGCFPTAQTEFVEQLNTKAQWDLHKNSVVMWEFGPYQADVNRTGSWGFVDATIDTQTRNGNWDWFTGAIHWYGTGGTTDSAAVPVPIPNSFYLSSKPAFFGSYQWPWVDPATGATDTLPAKYCFEHGKMPTCLQ